MSKSGESWDVVFYRADDGAVPGMAWLDGISESIRDRFIAVLDAVADAPPPRFSGGGYWEAMHGEMGGYYEVRHIEGGARKLHRLFCLLDRNGPGLPRPAIVILDGMTKPNQTAFKQRDYTRIRDLGSDYLASDPRRIAE